MKKSAKMIKNLVNGIEVTFKEKGRVTYVSLTDIAKLKNVTNPADVICKWMANKDSFDFYSLWEELSNPDFNLAESREIKTNELGYNSFTMSPAKWKKRCNAIGIIPSAGKYSDGTFAHPDIALEFAGWIDAKFKLYLIKEFQRLKEAEKSYLEWSAKRELAKINYQIHTDAIKESIKVFQLTPEQINYVYATEADMLNVALFGLRASQWKKINPTKKGNMRDYASIEQLLVLANMESYNAVLINQNISMKERIILLNDMAAKQLDTLALSSTSKTKLLKE